MSEILVASAGAAIEHPKNLYLQIALWFYKEFIPFVILYIGLPMFFLGILLAFAFAGGTLLFMFIFFIFMYYFIKGTIFKSNPLPKKK